MKLLTKHGLFLAFIFMALMLILHGCTEELPTREQIYPDCQGKIGDKCDIDTVEYKQHPCRRKVKNTWENR